MRSMGIGPAQEPARDAQAPRTNSDLSERAVLSRRARGPVRSMGIAPAKKKARDGNVPVPMFSEWMV